MKKLDPQPANRRPPASLAEPPETPFARMPGRFSITNAIELALGLGLLALVWVLARPLALLTLGISIAAALAPMVAWLARRVPRLLAIVLVYLVVLLLLVGIGWIIIPQLVNQAREISFRAPALIREMQDLFAQGDRIFGVSLMDTLLPQVGQFSALLISMPVRIISSLFDILLVLFISVYLLIEAPTIRRFLLSLFPAGYQKRVDGLVMDISQAMGGYVRGTVLTSIAVGFLTYLGLLVIGVDFPLVFGLLAGLLEVIPYLGPLIAAVPILIVALLESPVQGLVALIFLFVLQQFESLVLRPNIMHTQTAVSPLLVILAIIAGSTLGGLLGVIVAIPLAAGLRVVVKEVIAPAVRRYTTASLADPEMSQELLSE